MKEYGLDIEKNVGKENFSRKFKKSMDRVSRENALIYGGIVLKAVKDKNLVYGEPVSILFSKVPFLEFMKRMIFFIWNPKVCDIGKLSKSTLRFSLLDLLNSAVLLFITLGILSLFIESTVPVIMKVYSNSFVYSYYWLTLSFYRLLFFSFCFLAFCLLFSREGIMDKVVLVLLQYARYCALTGIVHAVCLTYLLKILVVDSVSPSKLMSENTIYVFGLVLLEVVMFVYLVGIPVCKVLFAGRGFVELKKIFAVIFFVVVSFSSFSSLKFVDVSIDVGVKDVCGAILKFNKKLAQSPDERAVFEKSCKRLEIEEAVGN